MDKTSANQSLHPNSDVKNELRKVLFEIDFASQEVDLELRAD
jgi:hypothetical protein